MKLSRDVWLFWLGNLVILAGFGLVLWNANNEARVDRAARNAAIANIQPEAKREPWEDTVTRETFNVADTQLSPVTRPKPPQPKVELPPPPPQVEKTDEQLKSELEAELNRKFTLLRLALSNTDEYPTIAMVVADDVRLQWFEGMNLKEEYGKSAHAELKRLAYDLKILSIDEQGVLVNAASFEEPAKRFDVRIRMFDGEQTNSMMNAQFRPNGRALRPIESNEPGETVPYKKDDAREKAERWGYYVPEEDYDKKVVDDFAKWTKSTEHGVQILPELPEDSPARKYGARGGEIIKSINGECVKSMSDVRRVVRTQYDNGTRDFKVAYERDGVPAERAFSAK